MRIMGAMRVMGVIEKNDKLENDYFEIKNIF